METTSTPPVDLVFLLDSIPALVSYVDRQQRYTFNNRAYTDWFGRPIEEFQGKHLREVLGAEAYAAVRPHVEKALAGEHVEYHLTAPYRDGGTREIRASYVPHRDETGAIRSKRKRGDARRARSPRR